MSQTSFLFAASCGSLLASRAFWASGDSATTGSAAWAADVRARKTKAAASSLMSTLLETKIGVILLHGHAVLSLGVSRRAENVRKAVVPFVAGVLVDRLVRPGHRELRRPRPDPRQRIVDGELVDQRV